MCQQLLTLTFECMSLIFNITSTYMGSTSKAGVCLHWLCRARVGSVRIYLSSSTLRSLKSHRAAPRDRGFKTYFELRRHGSLTPYASWTQTHSSTSYTANNFLQLHLCLQEEVEVWFTKIYLMCDDKYVRTARMCILQNNFLNSASQYLHRCNTVKGLDFKHVPQNHV